MWDCDSVKICFAWHSHLIMSLTNENSPGWLHPWWWSSHVFFPLSFSPPLRALSSASDLRGSALRPARFSRFSSPSWPWSTGNEERLNHAGKAVSVINTTFVIRLNVFSKKSLLLRVSWRAVRRDFSLSVCFVRLVFWCNSGLRTASETESEIYAEYRQFF